MKVSPTGQFALWTFRTPDFSPPSPTLDLSPTLESLAREHFVLNICSRQFSRLSTMIDVIYTGIAAISLVISLRLTTRRWIHVDIVLCFTHHSTDGASGHGCCPSL